MSDKTILEELADHPIFKEMFADAARRDALPAEILDHRTDGPGPNLPYNAGWLISAPFAHPIWSQYAILLYDLTTPMEGEPVDLARPDMTHEILVYALDPEKPVTKIPVPGQTEDRWQFLSPPNYVYQFKAANNELATQRIEEVAQAIAEKRLSPDTDFRLVWDTLFKDGAYG